MKISKEQIFGDLKAKLSGLLGSHLIKIILYGSYADNSNDMESDIDFLVLTNADDYEIRKWDKELTNISVELSLKYDLVFSIVVVNKEHYNKYLNVLPYYKNVATGGIEIYGK